MVLAATNMGILLVMFLHAHKYFTCAILCLLLPLLLLVKILQGKVERISRAIRKMVKIFERKMEWE